MKRRLTALGACGAALLMVIAVPTGQATPLASCGAHLTPAQANAVGLTCTLSPDTTVRVRPDLEVTIPERGMVASVAVLSTGSSRRPSELSVYRSTDDRLGIQIDEQPVRGDVAVAAAMARVIDRGRDSGPAPRALKAPSWCGSSSQYATHAGKWSGGQYRWLYNSKTQPDAGALKAITFGFTFITDDSSTCGKASTDATYSYRGATTKYTWGSRDNYNVVGWAGYAPETLAVTYWWTASNGYKVEADVGFNNRVKKWSTSPAGTVPSGRYDVISVATHEAGHVFGLDHYPQSSTQVMYPYIGTGVNKRLKRSGDLAGMAAKY